MTNGYEKSDARVAPLVLFGIALTLLVVVSMWLVGRIDTSLRETQEQDDARHPMRSFRKGPEGPLLQAVPRTDLELHLAEEDAQLSTYGWVDRPNGVARIPIDRAMQILNDRGLQTRPAGTK